MTQALQKAISLVGSQCKLAKKAGVSQPAISQAVQAGRVSARLALKIETATKGAVSKESLCPDIFSPSHEQEDVA